MRDSMRQIDNVAALPAIGAVDLFCGAGGLTHGLQKAGVNVCLGVDVDPACEYPYVTNNKAKFLLRAVEDLESDELADSFGESELRLLAGCAPCQTFSTYNRRATESDSRWWLLQHFMRLTDELLPDLVTMENVPRLKEQSVFKEFVSSLEANKYSVSVEMINCADYGVPQHRMRLVLLASRLGPISLVTAENFGKKKLTVMDAIGDLPPIEAGMSHPDDPLHKSSSLSAINLRRIKASKPGGSWRDWPKELVADCHKKFSGKTYPSVYGRMTWSEPAPTMTTQFYGFGNGRFGHPEQDRGISLREGAVLQSFPKNYRFIPPDQMANFKSIGRLIGNAVPVLLGEAIGTSLYLHVAQVVGLEQCRSNRGVSSGGNEQRRFGE